MKVKIKADMKPFSQQLHDENDQIAKTAVMTFIRKSWNLECEEGSKYGVDIEVFREGFFCGYVEVEKRHNWITDFPYKTVHVPARKEKFFGFFPTLLFSVRLDCKKAMYAKAADIVSSPIITIDNKYMDSERFFDVPIQKWTIVDL